MNFFAVSTIMGILAHLFIYATENGMPKFTVSWAYSVIGITSLVGKVGMGALSDRIGRKAAFFLSFVMAGTALTLLLHSPNMFTIYIFATIMGFSYGGWTPVFPATLGDFFGPESMGKIFSILMTNVLLGGIFGPVMAGWVFDRMDSYLIAFMIFSGICYLAAILSLSLKTPKLDL